MTEIINIIIALSLVMVIKDCYDFIKEILFKYYCDINKTNIFINFIAQCLNTNKIEDKKNNISESTVCIEEFDISE